jgi:hypothetical protein
MLKKNIFLIVFLLFASVLCNKSLADDAIIFLEHNPKNMLPGEEYSFHVTVDAKTNIDNLEVQLWVRDKHIVLLDAGVAAKDTDYYIGRIPEVPRSSTTFSTTSAAICGWGKLQKNQKAECAFWFRANGSTIDKIPFSIVAKDKSNNKILASYTLFYHINGKWFSRNIHYRSYAAKEKCSNFSRETQEKQWGDCFTKNIESMPKSFPMQIEKYD